MKIPGAAKKPFSWAKGVLAGKEVLVNLDFRCPADPGIELGWEAGSLFAYFKKLQQRRAFFA